MRRRGYHQRRHERTSPKTGDRFNAGQGGGQALVLLQKQRGDIRQIQKPQGELKQTTHKPGLKLGDMLMELSLDKYFNRMKQEIEQSVEWDYYEDMAGVKDDYSESGREYQKLTKEEKKKYLLEFLEDAHINWDHQDLWEEWFEELGDEISGLEASNNTNMWDVYAITRRKVKKGILLDIMDIWEKLPHYYYHSIQVYPIGKIGLALKYTYVDKKGSEWFYLIPHYKPRTSF